MKIIKARITGMPSHIFDKMPEVYVTYENKQERLLFTYYPDEISFHPREFIGLTEKEGRALWTKKDKEYLRK